MKRRGLVAGGTLVVVLWASSAFARPSDEEMFGASDAGAADAAVAGDAAATEADGGVAPENVEAETPAPAPAPESGAAAAPVEPFPSGGDGGDGTARDQLLLGSPDEGPRLSSDVAPDNPLTIGGQIYLRGFAQAVKDQNVGDVRVSAPALVDAYFDARPNDRVRGFVLGRMAFDPTLPTSAATTTTTTGSGSMTSGTSAPSVPLLSGVQSTRGPNVVLDQLWLRFDVERTVFVTAGRQHVKWGTARFWTPTDFLHPERRNPVATFDARPGFTMLKIHVPWEEKGWNFYAFGLVEGVRQLDKATGRYIAGSDGANTLGQLGGALRAEIVLGTAELGLDGVFYRGQKPRFGGDLSFGLGDFDLYVDAGFRFASDLPHRDYVADDIPFDTLTVDQWVDMKYPLSYGTGIKPQITTGGTYQLKYNDNDVFTIAAEYFFNSRGYDDPHIYPGLFLTNTFEFFYTGRHYAALSAILAAPWSWNYTTFSFATIGNLSDQSFISRLDYSHTLLTHLSFEAFVAANYGRTEGEFRLGVSQFALPNGDTFSLKPQTFSAGIGLRVKI